MPRISTGGTGASLSAGKRGRLTHFKIGRWSKRGWRFEFVTDALFLQLLFGFVPEVLLLAVRPSGGFPKLVSAFAYLLFVFFHGKASKKHEAPERWSGLARQSPVQVS